MENNPNFQQNYVLIPDAPNALGALILGIVTLVSTLSCAGVIPGIIGLILSSTANKAIRIEPDKYSEKSAKNAKIGKIMSLIGLIISAIGAFIFSIILVLGQSGILEEILEEIF